MRNSHKRIIKLLDDYILQNRRVLHFLKGIRFACIDTPNNPVLRPDLIRRDQHDIPDDPLEIRLFGVVRNEVLRLPYFLDYYRQLGVKRFFFVDNDSSDGTTEFLLGQPDCHVFHTKSFYLAAHCGVDWQNSLLNTYGIGHWIVLADADELLVYPGSEGRKLPVFATWLDQHGYAGIYTLLLDMYGDKPLDSISYRQGDDFLRATAHFDRDYSFVRKLSIPFLKPAFPEIEPIGGPRLRHCFPRQNTPRQTRGFLEANFLPDPRLWIKLKMRLARLPEKLGYKLKVEQLAPQVFKIPLVKWRRGYAFITSHRLNPIPLAPVTGALLHFKYFQDFAARVKDAIERKCHHNSSSEYQRYGELLVKNPALSMVYAGSERYKNSRQLVQLGLIRNCPDWA